MDTKGINSLKKITNFKNMPAIIAETLKEEIICNNIKPGTQLKQDDIAKRFNVSLIPVREAIITLESQGLIKCVRNKGAIVTTLSLDEMEEVFNLRSIIEVGAAIQAIPNFQEKDIISAKKILIEMESAEDGLKWSRLNWQFHEILYAPTKNKKLFNLIKALFVDIQRYTLLQFKINDNTEQPNKEHSEIIEAYINKDVKSAVTLINDHIESERQRISNCFES